MSTALSIQSLQYITTSHIVTRQWFHPVLGWCPTGPRPQATNCQGATVSEGIQTTVEWWSRGGEWGQRQISVFSLRPSSSPSLVGGGEGGFQKIRLVLCPAGLQSPHHVYSLVLAHTLRQQWISPSPLSLQPNSNGSLWVTSCGTCTSSFEWPEEPKGQKGWTPGSISDDSWVGPWNLALRELPTEICLFLED